MESFLELSPKVFVVLNVEVDHLDYYKDINMDDVYALKLGNSRYKYRRACRRFGRIWIFGWKRVGKPNNWLFQQS